MKTLLEKPNNAAITVQDNVTVKIINSLGRKFKGYFTVFNKNARNEKVRLDLNKLLKSLQDKKMCIVGKSLLNNIETGFFSGSFRDG